MSSADWRRILVKELSEEPRYEPDWRRPSRRVIAISARMAKERGWPVTVPYYHPSRYRQVYEKPRIAIIFDVSGAISKDFYEKHIVDLNDCIRQIDPDEVWTLYCDDKVRHVTCHRQLSSMALETPMGIPPSKGPSAYTPAFQYIVAHCCEIWVKGIVYLTDLRPSEPWEDLNKELPRLFYLTGAEKLLWLVPSSTKEAEFWKPPVGRIIWI